MRLIARSALIALLASGMLNLPLLAAAKPLGMVVTADSAHVGGTTKLAMGTNVFPGDYLDTDPGGTLRVKMGSTQIYLSSASAAVLEQDADTMGAKLTRGTLGFSSAQANEFEVHTPVATVRPAKGTAFGEVTLVGPHTIMVAAYRGSLLVSSNGMERVIPEGNSFNVSLAADADADPAGAGGGGNNPPQTGVHGVSNHGQIIFAAVVLGAAAGGAYAAWHYATESNPNPQQ